MLYKTLVDNGFVLKLKIVDKIIPMPIKQTIIIAMIIIRFFYLFELCCYH